MRKKLQHSMIVFLLSGLFLISVLITLIILLSSPEAGLSVEQEEQNGSSSVEKIIFEDFLLPPLKEESVGPAYMSREQLPRWDEEQVNRYWIPLKKIALDNIIEENDRRIEELFRDIP